MQLTTLALAAFAGLAAAGPVKIARAFGAPTDNGFPNPNTDQLLTISKQADGALSNAPPPPKLAPSSLTGFQVIAAQEQFESAYFSSLVANITNNVKGYELGSDLKKKELLDILQTVLAQEELHAINAQNVLKHFNATVPTPCQYNFGVESVKEAVVLAETFTAVVLATLQDVVQLFAKNGDDGAARAVASVIGQEGEQDGFYRILLARKPSQKPFLTTNVAPFAFSVLKTFIVPGSCDLSFIPVPTFPTLGVVSGHKGQDVKPEDQDITYTADLGSVAAAKPFLNGNGAGLFLTLLSGQDLPDSTPIKNVTWSGTQITFSAAFPYTRLIADGLSIASLTTSSSLTVANLANSTLAAPGLIQVYDHISSWDGIV